MRLQPRIAHCVACAIVTLTIAGWVSGDEKPDTQPALSQWAVIATGDAETRGIADLLTAELSSESDIQLVERNELNLALNELELAAYAGNDASQRLRLGQLLRADALVLLAIVEHEDKRFLKMTVSDCRYGARLLAVHFPLVEGQADEAVAQCTAAINTTRDRFPDGIQQIIGVPQFVSQNLTQFTNRGLAYLGGMKSLRTLTLYGKGFTDAGLRSFENPRNIYELRLYDTAFTGSGLAQLVSVKRGIRVYENGLHRTFK